MKFLASRNSVQGLVLYYVSLYGFVGSCLALSQGVNTWKGIGFALTLLATLIQDIDWFRKSRLHPHDMALIEKLSVLLEAGKTEQFLKNHDFTRYIYDDAKLAALDEIDGNWRGVDYEFVNPVYQDRWSTMRNSIHELVSLLRNESGLRGSNFYHMQPPKRPDAGDGEDSETTQNSHRADRANTLARSIYQDYQAFRKIHLQNRSVLKKS